MKTSLRVTGLSAFRQGITAAAQKVEMAANNGLSVVADKAFNEAQVKVPRETGALASSGKISNQDTVGYLQRIISYGNSTINPRTGKPTSDYALYVHEVFDEAHPENYKWLETVVRDYGNSSFIQELASAIRAAL